MFIQRLVALRLLQQTGLTSLKIVKQPVKEFRQEFCFAVRDGDRQTLALLNEGRSLVMADGTFRRLHAKWFAALELPSERHIRIGGNHNYPPYLATWLSGIPGWPPRMPGGENTVARLSVKMDTHFCTHPEN